MKNLIRVALAGVLAFQVTACKYQVDTRSIDADFADVVEQYKDEADSKTFAGSEKIAERIQKLDLIKTYYFKSISTAPAIKGQLKNNVADAEKWITANRASLIAWNQQVEKYGTSLRQRIFETSKASFNAKNPQEAIRDQITNFYALLYYTQGNKQMISNLMPFLLALGSEDLKGSKVVEAFKKEVTQVAFAQVGLSVILKQDLQKTTQALTALKKQTKLDENLEKLVAKTAQEFAASSAKRDASIRSIEEKLTKEQKETMAQLKAEVKKTFGNKSLLYTPGANSNALVNLLTWVGNLTWGLVNTLMGLGIVIVTMIVSPFTPYVDFPTFALAYNGKQIYADVTGMSPIPGKMSLGIWELDNGTGQAFASGHEGVHAVQSALFGPLYVPVVLFSYMISGFDQGFMEDWAWEWADSI
ncbi:hypothetical protein [Bdellovibrio sp. HCB2-146]|uniref:hypothetical protein n=1 Tax=Bdellovibrio sp. HCB2-146 TaxID=3394362 RepID=UPI0039BC4EA5